MTHELDYLTLLQKLIAFPSITPNDSGCLDYIAEILSEYGFKTYMKSFGSGEELTKNLYAQLGSSAPNICFMGHVDVVPPGNADNWKSDPFKASIQDMRIYGRGTVDMKGAIACMISAALNFVQNEPSYDGAISFLLTADEEGTGLFGTKVMLEWLKDKDINIDLAILGEPTSEEFIGDTIKIGRRGSINFELEIFGIQGHVAYPDKADNPISKLIKILFNLNNLILDQGSKFFSQSNLEITNLSSDNAACNVIPAVAKAKFNIRFNDLISSEELISHIQHITSSETKNFSLKSNVSAEAFIQRHCQFHLDLKKAIEDISGKPAIFSTSGGTSDARFIHQYCPVAEIGLKNAMAHKVDEYTEISDLQILYSMYYAALVKFLK